MGKRIDPAQIVALYRDGASIKEVAEIARCSTAAVSRTLTKVGEPKRSWSEAVILAASRL